MSYNYDAILKKLKLYNDIKSKLSKVSFDSYKQAFDIEYTHNSTAIEGNTLSLIETKAVIEDGVAVGGKLLREIYEVINHNKAFQYVRHCIDEKRPLDEPIVKDIHSMLMENIMIGGVYRMVDVYISGANHTPPTPNEMYHQVKNFYSDLSLKSEQINPIELAAWTHAEFVKIHPFADGNGRTSRLIMNYQLMVHGFLPVSIAKNERLYYFQALESYAVDGNLSPFAEFIAKLEDIQLDNYLNMTIEEK